MKKIMTMFVAICLSAGCFVGCGDSEDSDTKVDSVMSYVEDSESNDVDEEISSTETTTTTEATTTTRNEVSSVEEVESIEESSKENHVHKWVEATCTEPKTCSICGETEGFSLGHKW